MRLPCGRDPQLMAVLVYVDGPRHCRPKLYVPALVKLFACTCTTYVPVSASVNCCWPFAWKPTTNVPEGANTLALERMSAPEGKTPAPGSVSVTTTFAVPANVY